MTDSSEDLRILNDLVNDIELHGAAGVTVCSGYRRMVKTKRAQHVFDFISKFVLDSAFSKMGTDAAISKLEATVDGLRSDNERLTDAVELATGGHNATE